MNIKYSWLVKSLVVSSLSVMLSGCLSFMWLKAGDPHTTMEKWETDTVIGLSSGKDNDGNEGYVFVGKTFDYLITSGAESVVKLLQDPQIDRHNLQAVDIAKFIISDNKKVFKGVLTLKYTGETQDVKQVLTGYGFDCSAHYCTKNLSKLQGTIHKKSTKQDYSQMLTFYHPFTVGFYEYKTSHIPEFVTNGLLPITITLDVVTSPLQILFFNYYHQ
ncbi:YidX family protein [Citrobacter portucalensis]|uniref:hypothetical protein n=1 Tax=Citrobacter portucalensis TaxID=1639133 RepID=UPI001B828E3F